VIKQSKKQQLKLQNFKLKFNNQTFKSIIHPERQSTSNPIHFSYQNHANKKGRKICLKIKFKSCKNKAREGKKDVSGEQKVNFIDRFKQQ